MIDRYQNATDAEKRIVKPMKKFASFKIGAIGGRRAINTQHCTHSIRTAVSISRAEFWPISSSSISRVALVPKGLRTWVQVIVDEWFSDALDAQIINALVEAFG